MTEIQQSRENGTMPLYTENAENIFNNGITQDRCLLLAQANFHRQHRAMVLLAASLNTEALRSEDLILGLANGAYGWMPTILRDNYTPSFLGRFNEIKRLETYLCAQAFLDELPCYAPINGSWIGTSKLLHFINPRFFPIWDSKVARNFELENYAAINKKAVYAAYCNFMNGAAAFGNYNWVNPLIEKINTYHEYRPTPLRCLELVLFTQVHN